MKLIDQMRERPEEERIAFAAIAAGVVALILFLLWGLTFFRGGGGSVTQVDPATQGAAVLESFTAARSDISQAAEDITAQYDELKQIINTANTEVEAQAQGTNTVDLSVDRKGNVQVNTIVVPKEELDFEE